jgi:pyruvate,water dikinase
MMTDAMKPLGISTWQLLAAAPMHEAGGRLFVDVSRALASPAGRAGLLGMAGKSDPLTGDALATIIAREFIPSVPDATPAAAAAPSPPPATPPPIETDPAIVTGLIAGGLGSIEKLKRDIAGTSGPALFDFIVEDVKELKRVSFDPRGIQALMAGMEAAWWLNANLEEWLGERNAADTLAQSVPNNVTSEMGLDLLRVADVIRAHQSVVAFLQQVERDDFLDDLAALEGGRESRDAIAAWLERYGMRGVGEIDITRPRWTERPTALLPMLLGNIRNFEPGEADRRFALGQQAAREQERELIARLRALPDGTAKVEEMKRMIDRLRTFSGYREYPKYFIVNRTFAYRRALLKEAERLVQEQVIDDRDDVFYLTFEEFREAVRTRRIDHRLVAERREAFMVNERLTPPRVLTSEGEMVAGAYRREDLPPGALVGIPVSAGIVEGRARIILDPAKADLEPGDILVTRFTDPSWTPLFVGIRGLVTEVGGQMTHGAVIAREYGLPAVVGVENATRLIRDAQNIRVHGTSGFIELL